MSLRSEELREGDVLPGERIAIDPMTGEPVVQLDAAEQAEVDEAFARFGDGEVYVVTDVRQYLREQQARWEAAGHGTHHPDQ